MSEETVHIFGAGPTGMTLAWILSKRGKKVVIYEKYSEPGGTWTTKWLKDNNDAKLFTQHSPQILSTAYVNTIDLWKDMGMDYRDFTIPYKSGWTDMDTTFVDKLNLAWGYLRYLTNENKYEKVLVSDYFDGKLSDRGSKSLSEICYLLDGVPPTIMTVNELYGAFDQTYFYNTMEMSKASDDKEGFAKLWYDKLVENGVTFVLNTTLDRIENTDDSGILAYTLEDPDPIKINDEVILALDPLGLHKILNNSSDEIKDNWGGWEKLSQHILEGLYVSLSIQFHFEVGTDISVSKATQMGASTDWGLICVPVPLSVSEKPTLSSTILNMNAYSSVLQKHVDSCSVEEVTQEAWRQIRQANPSLPEKPLDITIGSGTTWDEKNGWKFDLSSASRTILGPLEARGKSNKLSIVGPLNRRRFKPTTMEAAVESAKLFTGEEIRGSLPLSNIIKCTIVIILMIIVVKVVRKVKK